MPGSLRVRRRHLADRGPKRFVLGLVLLIATAMFLLGHPRHDDLWPVE